VFFNTNVAGIGLLEKETSAATMSVGVPTKIHATTQGSAASTWIPNNGSGTVMTLSYPAGAVVDVDVEFILSDNITSNTTVTPANSGSNTKVYYVPLDGITTHNLLPSRLNTLY
jgi:hypothetical protein